MFNGRTVYDAYERLNRVPRVVHDIHLTEADIISDSQLASRLARDDGTLRIIYVGRVHEMKGPREWLEAVQRIADGRGSGHRVEATWIGDGPLLSQMRREVESRQLSDRVSFPGPEADRARAVARLWEADLFVFCHLTPESPRCLIEALMSGLPIVGFASAYALDLLAEQTGGGAFVPVGDTSALARQLQACLDDPGKLRDMSRAAHAAGKALSEVGAFRHRSELIREFL